MVFILKWGPGAKFMVSKEFNLGIPVPRNMIFVLKCAIVIQINCIDLMVENLMKAAYLIQIACWINYHSNFATFLCNKIHTLEQKYRDMFQNCVLWHYLYILACGIEGSWGQILS